MEDNLEQMHRQISLLKDRLAQYEIISDDTIERTISRYIKEYNRTRRQNLIISLSLSAMSFYRTTGLTRHHSLTAIW